MAGSTRGSPRRRSPFLSVEALEDRSLLSSSSVSAAVMPLPPTGNAVLPEQVALPNASRTADYQVTPSAVATDSPPGEQLSLAAPFTAFSADLASNPGTSVDRATVAGPPAPAGSFPAAVDSAGRYTFDLINFGLGHDNQVFDAARFQLSLAGPLDPAPGLVTAARPGALLPAGGLFAPPSGGDFLLMVRRNFDGQRLLFNTSGSFDPLDGPPLTLNPPSALRLRADAGPAGPWADLWAEDRGFFLAGLRRYERTAESGPANGLGPTGGPTVPGQAPAGMGPGLRGVLPSERTAGDSLTSPLPSAAVTGATLAAGGRAGVIAGREAVRVALSLPVALPQAAGPVLAALLAPSPLGGAAADGDSTGPPVSVPHGATLSERVGRSVLLLGAGVSPADPRSPGDDGTAGPSLVDTKGFTTFDLPAQAAALLEGGLPFDVPALGREVDAFFAHLAVLGEANGTAQAGTRFLSWAVLLTGAAFEIARRCERSRSQRLAADELLPGPVVFLPDEDR